MQRYTARLHQHSFWLFSIVVGLAIREALLRVLPPLIEGPGSPWDHLSEATRLIVFLVLAVKFFLGAFAYFDEVYFEPETECKYENKNYGVDFLFGFVHFLLFLALAMSIDARGPAGWLFATFVVIVLLYDLAWWFVLWCWKFDCRKRVSLWAFINLLTVLTGVVICGSLVFSGWDNLAAERWAYAPVFVVGMIDIAELVRRRPIFRTWLALITGEEASPVEPLPAQGAMPAEPEGPAAARADVVGEWHYRVDNHEKKGNYHAGECSIEFSGNMVLMHGLRKETGLASATVDRTEYPWLAKGHVFEGGRISMSYGMQTAQGRIQAFFTVAHIEGNPATDMAGDYHLVQPEEQRFSGIIRFTRT